MINAQNPPAFLLLLFLIPALIISLARFRAVAKYFPLGVKIIAPFCLRVSAFICLVCASADISWGERPVFSERSSLAVSFVFDISYSMTARDAMENSPSDTLPRLDAAGFFARGLMRHFKNGVPVSVVIAKGDAAVAVPLTTDRAQIDSFLDALSPDLMTAPGSSIGKGIDAACLTFPSNFAYKPVIIVFTDGDETDSAMRDAAMNAARAGISLYFIGLGGEDETEIIAGDGVTPVKTSLKKDALIRVVESIRQFAAKNYAEFPAVDARFFAARERGSAVRFLDALDKNAEQMMTAEIQSVPRRELFLALAVLFFAASILSGYLRVQKFPRAARFFFPAALIAICAVSCSPSWTSAMEIFTGTVQWRRGRYQEAARDFIAAYKHAEQQKEQVPAEYALLGLAVTDISRGNYPDAEKTLLALSENASGNIKSAALYNCGVIASNAGDYDKAADFFKRALQADSANIDAKLNLEIAQSRIISAARQMRQDLIPASSRQENPSAAARQIFSYLRQMDENQWKTNVNGRQNNSPVIDY